MGVVGADSQASDNLTKFPSPEIGEFSLKPPRCERGTGVRKYDKASRWRRGRHCRKLPGPKTKGRVGMKTSRYVPTWTDDGDPSRSSPRPTLACVVCKFSTMSTLSWAKVSVQGFNRTVVKFLQPRQWSIIIS